MADEHWSFFPAHMTRAARTGSAARRRNGRPSCFCGEVKVAGRAAGRTGGLPRARGWWSRRREPASLPSFHFRSIRGSPQGAGAEVQSLRPGRVGGPAGSGARGAGSSPECGGAGRGPGAAGVRESRPWAGWAGVRGPVRGGWGGARALRRRGGLVPEVPCVLPCARPRPRPRARRRL